MVRRETDLESLKRGGEFDLLVVGGGATGCGVALDAASRGLRVALVEREDFASGTSGRSTKLVHGGVRYLEAALTHLDRVQFNLVREGLHERGILLRLAPHLCHRLPLVTPLYGTLEVPYVWFGLKLYDLLAGRLGLGHSRFLRARELLRRFPMIRSQGLKGGVLYYDGQFNDARMNLALALTARQQSALVLNYLEVQELLHREGRVAGALVRDGIEGDSFEIRARCVVNATGPWSDLVRRLDDPRQEPLLAVSSGSHLVLPASFAPAGAGITIPRTEDGRVLFILPWLGGCLVGTTDNPARLEPDPQASPGDIDYLVRHLKRYFNLEVAPSDITAAWCGLRPLVQDPAAHDTARLARDHVVNVSGTGLVSIAGGKWTTYRRMAQDAVDAALRVAQLAPGKGCHSDRIPLWGADGFHDTLADELAREFHLEPEQAAHLSRNYGGEAGRVLACCRGALAERLVAHHPYLKGEVVYAVRHEMVRHGADFLLRRIPLGLLDQAAALEAVPAVLDLMSRELSWSPSERAVEAQRLSTVLHRPHTS
ncbi:glycerol-3-phosphate dehydrogenase [Geomonas limicola]|uniref:Glycerol-3-phosphate dehydrogenase n=1 Tax=Geomonas limicola TaxID=2740186 RepID=A0A6V8NCE3_9BACT|nr:FAD-dependent oxidoreductase [Geomonas limicola]GFO69554.1 glycerol-3-phosphate dehydrogenase [Geomonas limicola]